MVILSFKIAHFCLFEVNLSNLSHLICFLCDVSENCIVKMSRNYKKKESYQNYSFKDMKRTLALVNDEKKSEFIIVQSKLVYFKKLYEDE